jgi:hypothetical protein
MGNCNHTVTHIDRSGRVLSWQVPEVDCPHCLRIKIEHLQTEYALSRQLFTTHEAAGSCVLAEGGKGLADLPPELRADCEKATSDWLAYWRAVEAKEGGKL